MPPSSRGEAKAKPTRRSHQEQHCHHHHQHRQHRQQEALTKQELIATNIKLLIEQLEAGHSDALTAYLTAMSRFHQNSFGNVLEIARQMPSATRVAGFWAWQDLGRSVNAGAKGIRILAPIVGTRRNKDAEAQKDITKQNERVTLGSLPHFQEA